jgi:cytosine/adenosine deaminase-related metal-dependent hydrolase
MDRTIYRNASLLVGRTLDYVEKGCLAAEDGIIAEIIENGPSRFGGEETVDCTGLLLLPGFVNAHTHIGDSVCKDAGIGLPTKLAVSPPSGLKYRELAKLTAEQLEKALSSALLELLSCGITSFCDFREGGVPGTEALREALSKAPVRGIIIGEPAWERDTLETESYLHAVDGVLAAADGIGIGDIADFEDAVLRGLADRVEGEGKLLAVHAAETEEAQRRCIEKRGVPEIERISSYKPDLLIHVTNPTEEELRTIESERFPVVCCTRTNAVLADGIPPLGRLFAMDIPLGLGTDNMMFTSPDMFREMDFVSRLARVSSRQADTVCPRNILRAATIGGAEVLKRADAAGSLEAGKSADIIAVDLQSPNLRGVKDLYSALVHRASARDIRFISASGVRISF